jgi:AraC-like DNA-binding protein
MLESPRFLRRRRAATASRPEGHFVLRRVDAGGYPAAIAYARISASMSTLLDAALEQLRLEGAIFFRAELSEAWSYETADDGIAEVLHPGAQRLIMFHIVATGSCWVSIGDGERHWAHAGDVVVLPYGDQHRVGGIEPADPVPILTLLDPPPWEYMPVMRYGAGGDTTDIVCGYLHSEDPLFDPKLRALPPVFVVRPEGPAARWVESSIEYALAASEVDPRTPLSTRIPEALLVEVLRLHLASAPASDHGWLAALRDPVLAPALGELHAAPADKWTVATLAARVAVSRSVLDERFRTVLGRSPIRYLTEWRMHVATELLEHTELGVAQVARRVGYDSEEAFSRAFKRRYGHAPSVWRQTRT